MTPLAAEKRLGWRKQWRQVPGVATVYREWDTETAEDVRAETRWAHDILLRADDEQRNYISRGL